MMQNELTFSEVMTRFKQLLTGEIKPLLPLWLLYALVALVYGLILAGIQYAGGGGSQTLAYEWIWDPSMLTDPSYMRRLQEAQEGQAGWTVPMIYLTSLGGSALLLGIYGAMMRPLRDIVHGGQAALQGSAFGRMKEALPSSVLFYFVWIFGVFVGTLMCCLPGMLVALFWYPAMYMTAARKSVGGGLRGVQQLFSAKPGMIILLAVLQTVFGMFVGFASISMQIILIRVLGEMGLFAQQVLSTTTLLAMGFFMWLFSGTAYAMIEQRYGLSLDGSGEDVAQVF